MILGAAIVRTQGRGWPPGTGQEATADHQQMAPGPTGAADGGAVATEDIETQLPGLTVQAPSNGSGESADLPLEDRAEEGPDDMFEFITEGVLLTTISVLGFVGNGLSIYVLLKPSVRGVFSNILTALASFDALFLLLATVTFGLPSMSDSYKDNLFLHVTPICYGLTHTFRVGSVFATLSVTLERFFAIVFPLRDFSCVKRWLIPTTVMFTAAYNVPKFFEVTTTKDPVTNRTVIVGTDLRHHPLYKTLYVVWSKLILTELFPYLAIVVLNSFIIVKIIQSARFRRKVLRNEGDPHHHHHGGGGQGVNGGGQPQRQQSETLLRTVGSGEDRGRYLAANKDHRTRSSMVLARMGRRRSWADQQQMRTFLEKQRQEHKMGILLVGISFLFICCQSFKIIPDLYEVIFCKEPPCPTTPFISTCVSLSHLLVCFNSAANCVIYLMGGEKFRRVWINTYLPARCYSCCCYCCCSGHGRGGGGRPSRNAIPLRTWTFRGHDSSGALPPTAATHFNSPDHIGNQNLDHLPSIVSAAQVFDNSGNGGGGSDMPFTGPKLPANRNSFNSLDGAVNTGTLEHSCCCVSDNSTRQ